MQTKLTLRLEKQLVDSAKEYASSQGKSVSKMVADYFTLLKQIQKTQTDEIAPITQSLKGALGGAKINVSDYKKYLVEKHL
jgi:replicative DNA helicase